MATIIRKELYKKVWEMPITQLSKEYGLSDVELAKICKKHNRLTKMIIKLGSEI